MLKLFEHAWCVVVVTEKRRDLHDLMKCDIGVITGCKVGHPASCMYVIFGSSLGHGSVYVCMRHNYYGQWYLGII